MKKTLGILSKSRDMADFYAGLLSGLLGGTAEIYASSLEDGSIRKLRDCDLYLVSVTSYDLIYHSWAKGFLPPEARTVQASVTFSMKAVETLRAYPEGTKALLVNQTRHMAMESISQLYHLGISNIEFLPCYPGSENPPEVLTVFTPGEADLAPAGAAVVDLGPRSLTANTVCEIALRLGNPVFLESREFAAYTAALAGVDYSLQTLTYNSLTMESKLELILNALDAGIVCVDEEGLVTLVNRAAEEQLCSSRERLLGRPAAEALPELPFADGPRLASILGRDFSVTTAPLYIRERSLGTFAVLRPFQEVEEQQATLRLQKTPKSHHARYTFHDIEGTSPAIRKTREIARRVAGSSASIMLDGESGTGKELFAQAIHNASPRRERPFIAVNCAALSETLLESELFGYEDGAFTGARKGGRAGLFECAHQGTLFLDEIETVSPAFQAKLLRVLQEQEVVRIGSVNPIPVDVRVLSATNEDLSGRVRQGSFRRDLYYRLNVIPIHIPALRERREDILLLADSFRRQFRASFTLSGPVQEALLRHRWTGNIRELRNCMEYLHHMGLKEVSLEDLPEQFLDGASAGRKREAGLSGGEWAVWQALGDLYPQNRGIGRQGLVRTCGSLGVCLSEHEVRALLRRFQEAGWLAVGQGRGGTRLTEAGYARYLELRDR
ncbi:sigma-54-dependent Fis family transcriptional regulator [uncultured Oscillibacter sp.]|uniref:sigma-54 interaction domain-containing protein n=1 Tax=uncultured Oscillibacter sp. TaxID=876091 RepID=UPI00261508D5|nr:sigma 54-interacting transcriptional regulator [uncultured Oscillibacter sp.]